MMADCLYTHQEEKGGYGNHEGVNVLTEQDTGEYEAKSVLSA